VPGGRAGLDVGGTKCLGVVLGADGGVVREARVPTPRGSDALVAALAGLAEELRPWDTLGLGIAGRVTLGGEVPASPNLRGVRDAPVRALLEAALGVPVPTANDATCATLAEWRMGAARGAGDVVLVTLGTGIGGGFVVGGRLVLGRHGFAGEVGHMVVDPDGIPCVCGRRGCWERYASGAGIAVQARVAAEAGRLDVVVGLAGGDPEAVRGEHVHAAARDGDPEALAVLDGFAWWVALGLANLVNVTDPEVVVVGGGLGTAADLFLEPVRRHLREWLYSPDERYLPAVVAAGLGEQAGAIGAALLAAEPAALPSDPGNERQLA
jgi:glucokinase